MKLLDIILLACICLSGCRTDDNLNRFPNETDSFTYTEQEHLLAHIDSMLIDGDLTDREVIILSLKSSELRDSLQLPMLPDSLLSNSLALIGKNTDKYYYPRLLFYLGRSYMEIDKKALAIETYLHALEHSDTISDNNLCGYIYSYMADPYKENLDLLEARKYYERAGSFFSKAGNNHSQIVALCDQGDT